MALTLSFHMSAETADSFAVCQQFHRSNDNKRMHAQGRKHCPAVGTITSMPGEPHATNMIILYVEGQSTHLFFLKGKTKTRTKNTQNQTSITDHLTHKITWVFSKAKNTGPLKCTSLSVEGTYCSSFIHLIYCAYTTLEILGRRDE